jgi:hypothetical protein
MRDLFRSIAHIERTATRGLDTPSRLSNPDRPRKSKITTWRAPDAKPQAAERETVFRKPTPMLNARSIKVTIPLNPAEILSLAAPDGQPRVKLQITHESGQLRAEVSAKSVRKTQAAIREAGAENMFVALQGRLGHGEILECGLTAQVKATSTPKVE